jgi:hypothetical protein
MKHHAAGPRCGWVPSWKRIPESRPGPPDDSPERIIPALTPRSWSVTPPSIHEPGGGFAEQGLEAAVAEETALGHRAVALAHDPGQAGAHVIGV